MEIMNQKYHNQIWMIQTVNIIGLLMGLIFAFIVEQISKNNNFLKFYSERKSLASKNPVNSFESCSENNPNSSNSR